ncbi:MAG: hypothetical protein JW737_09160 [Acidobacteria bacterium]|nr:hypothetical protein [Acidobacteriota bacterium]
MIKKLFIYIAIFLCISTGILADDISCKNERDFKNPEISSPEVNGWAIYNDIFTITIENAGGLNPGNISPEAALTQFYASLIRRDKCYLIALPPGKMDSDLQRSVDEVTGWNFLEIRLEKRKKLSKDSYWISLWMKIEFQGKIESGTDDAALEKIGGKWYIVDPPT